MIKINLRCVLVSEYQWESGYIGWILERFEKRISYHMAKSLAQFLVDQHPYTVV